MKCAKYFISLAVLVAPVVAAASRGPSRYCAIWRMGSPTGTQPDGGATSTECTCAAWNGWGEQWYGCDLCAPGPPGPLLPDGGPYGGYAPVVCLQPGSVQGGGGCSAAGGSAAMGQLAVLSVLLFCRRRK